MSKIFDFVKPGVITGDDVQKVFAVAKENNFALPAVNCVGTDSINAVLETAAKVRAPVIVQFSNGGAAFIAGKGVKTDVPQGAAILGAISGAHHVHQLAEHYGVPVILHTDHCAKKLLPWLDGLLDAGEKHFAATGKPLFSSHMIDLSEESLEENIEICSKYLTRMAKLGMTLEIELGCTGGEEDGVDNSHMDASALYTQPEDVAYAYEKLNAISPRFTIAASFGNVHGVYKPGNVKLTPTILRDSQDYVSKKFNLPHNSLNFRVPRRLRFYRRRDQRVRRLRRDQNEHRYRHPMGQPGTVSCSTTKRTKVTCRASWATRKAPTSRTRNTTIRAYGCVQPRLR
ncbi:Fructose-bisphosphate aldolase class 2 [Serratia plymuthica]|uniref:Fructose-bisphosphate aldolase n=1 Tax=Serratia plymuthica TaxID=82996 RepID=A0A2X4V1R5_SERPL|nr:Fructose-bisphosphate aldolase class 2 [Serratia plymuthica]